MAEPYRITGYRVFKPKVSGLYPMGAGNQLVSPLKVHNERASCVVEWEKREIARLTYSDKHQIVRFINKIRGRSFRDSYQHEIPETNCNCGYYSWLDPAELLVYTGSGAILAEVGVEGKVQFHTHGFRAEYQPLIRIWWPACERCKVQEALHVKPYDRDPTTPAFYCNTCHEPEPKHMSVESYLQKLSALYECEIVPETFRVWLKRYNT